MEKEYWYRYDAEGKAPEELTAVQKSVRSWAEQLPGDEVTFYWNNQVSAFFLQSRSALEYNDVHKLGFRWINPVEEGDPNLLVLERLWENY